MSDQASADLTSTDGRGCFPYPAPLVGYGYYFHRSFDFIPESNRIFFYYKI
jgi:hypothetical protein